MNYKALYRTYRSANFSEVVGQDHIIKTLTNLIKLRKISHAYLFSGPRGTGKTSVAKIFANVINCGHNVNIEVACRSCIMTINNSVDIIEIDAASNNGISEIRELREKVKFTPTKFKYKIYIIDEVHMLTKGAFNALLKTLEEPPKHIIFILATTDPEKLPLTILSRLQRYNFKRITKEVIQKQMNFVFEKENIKSETGVIEMISVLANGSLRDALSIVDQINAYSNSDIKVKDINDIFGLTSTENQVLLLNYCADNFVGLALKLFDELVNQGIDITRLINSLIKLLKDHLLYLKTKDESIIEEFDIETLNKMEMGEDLVYKVMDILITLLNEIKYSDIPQQLFQIAIIKICSFNNSFNNVSFNTIKSVDNDIKNEETMDKRATYHKEINEITNNFVIQNINENTSTNSLDIEESNILQKQLKTDINQTEYSTKLIDYENTEISKDRIIEDVTDILTLSNETNIDVDMVEDSILGSLDSESVIYDTNEFSTKKILQNKEEREVKTKLFDTLQSDDKEFSFDNNFNDNTVENNEEKPITLTQPDIINLFLLGDKMDVVKTKEKLSEALLLTDDRFSKIITYLENCKIITSSKDFILMSSDDGGSIDYLVLNSITPIFKDFIYEVFDAPKHFYAITKTNFLDSAELFKELKSKDKLPEITPLAILKNREKVVSASKENFEAEKKGLDIFGRIFKARK